MRWISSSFQYCVIKGNALGVAIVYPTGLVVIKPCQSLNALTTNEKHDHGKLMASKLAA